VGVRGNERADQLAVDAVRPSDFLPFSRVRLLNVGRVAGMVVIWEDMLTLFGLWSHLCHDVGALKATESYISMISRMMENHSCLRSHMGRIGIVESPMCVCSQDYVLWDHVLWGCERFDAERPQLWMDLRLTDTEWGTPIRDILGGRDWRSLRGNALSLDAAT
jgi:hypothetical protein